MKSILAITGLAVLVMAFVSNGAPANDKEIVDYREHIMKTLNEQSAALGQILSAAVPGDNTVAHMEELALTAAMMPAAFQPKALGGEAKPTVWSDWGDFSKRMNAFIQKTAAMVKVAKEKGPDEAMGSVVDALSCKGCHDVYRDENK